MTTIERRLGRVASSFNARARRYHSLGVVDWHTLVLIHVRFGGSCYYQCGTHMELEFGTWDHAIPLSEGGRNDLTNIVRCCVNCQRRKFTKTPAEYDAHRALIATCARPGCGNTYKPRWAEWQAGRARYCSHQCSGSAAHQKELA